MSTLAVRNQTRIRKGQDGWEAKTDFNISGGKYDGRQIRLSTYKGNSGLYTSAQVMDIKPNGTFSFVLFQDPSKTIVRPEKVRVNEKAVTEQHARALEILNADTTWLD